MPMINDWSNTITAANAITLSTTNGTITSNSGSAATAIGSSSTGSSSFGNLTGATTVNFGSGSALTTYKQSTSFTPTLTFGSASVGMTFSTQTGTYTRIGNIICINIIMVLTAKGSSTGVAQFGGLPFNNKAQGAIGRLSVSNVVFTGSHVNANTNGANSVPFIQNAGAVTVNLTHAAFANNSELYLSGTYLT